MSTDLQFDPVDQGFRVPSLHHLRDERADFNAAGSDDPQGGDSHRFIDRGANLFVARHPPSKRSQGVLKAFGYPVDIGIRMRVEPGSDLGPELVHLLQHDRIVKNLAFERLASCIHLRLRGEVIDQLIDGNPKLGTPGMGRIAHLLEQLRQPAHNLVGDDGVDLGEPDLGEPAAGRDGEGEVFFPAAAFCGGTAPERPRNGVCVTS